MLSPYLPFSLLLDHLPWQHQAQVYMHELGHNNQVNHAAVIQAGGSECSHCDWSSAMGYCCVQVGGGVGRSRDGQGGEGGKSKGTDLAPPSISFRREIIWRTDRQTVSAQMSPLEY